MASESFKEDLLQDHGSFVEKPGKGEVRMVGSSKRGRLPGRREAAGSHRRTCTLHREPQQGFCLCTPRLAGVGMCVDACACAFVYPHMHALMCAQI